MTHPYIYQINALIAVKRQRIEAHGSTPADVAELAYLENLKLRTKVLVIAALTLAMVTTAQAASFAAQQEIFALQQCETEISTGKSWGCHMHPTIYQTKEACERERDFWTVGPGKREFQQKGNALKTDFSCWKKTIPEWERVK